MLASAKASLWRSKEFDLLTQTWFGKVTERSIALYSASTVARRASLATAFAFPTAPPVVLSALSAEEEADEAIGDGAVGRTEKFERGEAGLQEDTFLF